MASETDDLEQVIRQNLKLRRELGAAVAEAEDNHAKQRGGGLLGSPIVGARQLQTMTLKSFGWN
jgi:hypothetical protein